MPRVCQVDSVEGERKLEIGLRFLQECDYCFNLNGLITLGHAENHDWEKSPSPRMLSAFVNQLVSEIAIFDFIWLAFFGPSSIECWKIKFKKRRPLPFRCSGTGFDHLRTTTAFLTRKTCKNLTLTEQRLSACLSGYCLHHMVCIFRVCRPKST